MQKTIILLSRKRLLNAKISKENYFQSKMAILPNLNLTFSDNTSFGRNIDPVTNQITIDRVRNNNFGIVLLSHSLMGFSEYK